MQNPRQLQPVRIKYLLSEDLAVPQSEELIVNPFVVGVGELREEILLWGAWFLQVTTQSISTDT